MEFSRKTKILIIGGGTGGISVASRLSRKLSPNQITIIDPSQFHYYQPLWTLVGAGHVHKNSTRKQLSLMIPNGVNLISDAVLEIHADQNKVICQSGLEVFYDYLVVASGLKLDWNKIKGIKNNLGTRGINTIYQIHEAEQTFRELNEFRGGHVIFTMPPVPIKCAGAPQKIMYLADEIFRKNGVRAKTKITFAVAGKLIFGVPSFAEALLSVAKKKDINLLFSHKLTEIKAEEKIAIFEASTENSTNGTPTTEQKLISLNYDLIHVVPPMSPHDFIQKSGLTFSSGPQENWLKVDPFTLQHLDYPRIFGIGDVTGIPNSKTGAAIRKQAPVVTKNLLNLMNNRPLTEKYDGYSSCPLITGFGKVILAEFGYDGQLMPSFPMDMTKERYSMWILKKYLLPVLYWFGMMRGRF